MSDFQLANNQGIFKTFLYYLRSSDQLQNIPVLFSGDKRANQGSYPRVVISTGDFSFEDTGYVKNQNPQVQVIWTDTEYLLVDLLAVSREPNPTVEDHKDAVMALQAKFLSALYSQKGKLFSFEVKNGRWNNDGQTQGMTEYGSSKKLIIAINIPVLYEPLNVVEVEQTSITAEIIDTV